LSPETKQNLQLLRIMSFGLFQFRADPEHVTLIGIC